MRATAAWRVDCSTRACGAPEASNSATCRSITALADNACASSAAGGGNTGSGASAWTGAGAAGGAQGGPKEPRPEGPAQPEAAHHTRTIAHALPLACMARTLLNSALPEHRLLQTVCLVT